MTKSVWVPFALCALMPCLAGARAWAQSAPGPLGAVAASVTISFAMPESRDPSRLTITQMGRQYTNTDGASPGDNLGAAITGGLLASANGGLELHGLVASSGGTTPVTEVDFYTTYTGTLALTSTSVLNFTPWDYGFITPLPGYAQGFRFFKTNSSQADLNVNAYFGVLTATLSNPNNPNSQVFLDSSVGSTGAVFGAVPEPGAVGLFGGLCMGGGLLWRRRRHRSR